MIGRDRERRSREYGNTRLELVCRGFSRAAQLRRGKHRRQTTAGHQLIEE